MNHHQQFPCFKTHRLMNLTQHTIKLFQPDDSYIEITPSGKIARVTAAPEIVGYVGEIPVIYKTYGSVVNLPDPVENVLYITSSLTAEVVKRPDVVSPDTTYHSAVRDESGTLIGVKVLRAYAPMKVNYTSNDLVCQEITA